jgi:hypothetical protein
MEPRHNVGGLLLPAPQPGVSQYYVLIRQLYSAILPETTQHQRFTGRAIVVRARSYLANITEQLAGE